MGISKFDCFPIYEQSKWDVLMVGQKKKLAKKKVGCFNVAKLERVCGNCFCLPDLCLFFILIISFISFILKFSITKHNKLYLC